MEQVIKPSDEFLMWRAHLTDSICNEYIQDDKGKFLIVPFTEIQKRDDLIKFELVGLDKEIYFNTEDGIFHIGEHTYKITIINKNTGEDLLEGKKNNLMMYRQASREFASDITSICAYHYGYKIDSKYCHIKLRMTIDEKGYSFHAVVTGKEDFQLEISIVRDNEVTYLAPNTVDITKDRTFNLDM